MAAESVCNQDVTLLASAAHATASAVVTPDQDNPFWSAAVVYFNCTVYGSVGTTTVAYQVKDPVSGVYTSASTVSVTGTGMVVIVVGLGASGAFSKDISAPLTRTWRVSVTAPDANSNTYSIGASLIR